MNISTYRPGVALLLAAVLAAGGTARAQTAPPSIAECTAIAADLERLACYDRASGRAAGEPPTPEKAPAPEAPAAAAEKPALSAGALRVTGSLIDTAWGFDAESTPYIIDLYNQNYLLVTRYTNKVNTAPFTPLFQAAGEEENLDNTEAKFQISFKLRLWTTDDRRWGVWAAYTQQSQWQVYNDDSSRPFRETNYMPEVFVSYRPGLELGGGFHWNLLNVGYNHQSNGRSDVRSRSWDRIIAEFGFERGNFALLVRPGIRSTTRTTTPTSPTITATAASARSTSRATTASRSWAGET